MENRERMNASIGCNVKECRFNVLGANCSLEHIHIGGCCSEKHCTCCDNYEKID